MERIAGQALGVHPDEDILAIGDIAVDERDMLSGVDVVLESGDPEFTERRRQTRIRHAMHQPLILQAMRDELRHGDEGEPVLRGKSVELIALGRRAVVVEDLTDHPCRRQAGHPRQIDRGFGMPDALQHATLARA